MDKPTGTVVELLHGADGRRATIAVEADMVCARCAAGKGCGAGLLAGSGRARRIEAAVDDELRLTVGDTVRIKLAPRSLLSASVHGYGAPLLGLLTASLVAYVMSLGDIEAAAASLAGMAVGVFISRLYLQRPSCLGRFHPRVDAVL